MKKILLTLMLCLFTTQMAFATATGIKSYSSTPGNNTASPPNGAPEGWAPSQVNDVVRQIMAEVRRWYEDPAWIDYGYTYVYASTTSFKISGIDTTANFVVGRRVRAVGSSTGTIYGTIATSAFSTDTTVTVTWDSGTLANEALAISIGFPTSGAPIPASAVSGIAAATDATISTSDITTNNVTSTKHGWAPKSPADATQFLNGAATPGYAQPKDSDLAVTDITTNNATTSAHGFAPKADGNSAHYLNGLGGYSSVSGIPTVTNSSAGKIVISGVTIEWGTCTANTAVTFPTSFSSTPYSITATASTGFQLIWAGSAVSTGFTPGSNGAFPCYWQAIGPT